MPNHRVEKGEWIGSVVAKEGHKAWRPIWDLPKNTSLRNRRDPNLLVEGDLVWVPAVEPKEENAPVDTRSTFVWEQEEDKFIIRIVEVAPYITLFGPISYRLKVGKHEKSGQITAEGEQIELPLELRVEEGTLWLEQYEYKLDIGALDPLRRLSGMQARINNLGWDAGTVDNAKGPSTRRGTKAFQAFYEIKVNGIIGNQTRNKAKEIYGC